MFKIKYNPSSCEVSKVYILFFTALWSVLQAILTLCYEGTMISSQQIIVEGLGTMMILTSLPLKVLQ